jgi:U3 small nucleolar ribonucleoprotein component
MRRDNGESRPIDSRVAIAISRRRITIQQQQQRRFLWRRKSSTSRVHSRE